MLEVVEHDASGVHFFLFAFAVVLAHRFEVLLDQRVHLNTLLLCRFEQQSLGLELTFCLLQINFYTTDQTLKLMYEISKIKNLGNILRLLFNRL